MSDRKYENRQGGLWHKEGGYMVPDDEPLCTLRAKDPDSIYALIAYILRCSDVATATEDEEAIAHMQGAQETLAEFIAWQQANPSRMKRGCHRCDDC